MPTFREDLHLGHNVPLVETDDIRKGAITTDLISDDAVTTEKIADGAVTSPKIADDAIIGSKIVENSIGSRHIADGAVNCDKLQEESVESRHIADGAVTHDKLAPEAVEQLDTATEDAVNAAARANEVADHPDFVNDDNYVYRWDFERHKYYNTGIYVKGDKGDKGDSGNLVYPEFEVTPSMHLLISDADNITLENGHLMVAY